METLLTNFYTRLDENSRLFETNSLAIGTKELRQKKSSSKNAFLYKMTFINRKGLCTYPRSILYVLNETPNNVGVVRLHFVLELRCRDALLVGL